MKMTINFIMFEFEYYSLLMKAILDIGMKKIIIIKVPINIILFMMVIINARMMMKSIVM